MRGGISTFLATAALLGAGCAADTNQFEIRAIADPLTKAARTANPAVSEARGLLALGSVGLAIEAFRKVLRDQPHNAEAMTGLAECYDRMGRHDLARLKYEAALAVAPNDPQVLNAFAAHLERQGRVSDARELRAEAAAHKAIAAAPPPEPRAAPAREARAPTAPPTAASASSSVTVALPPVAVSIPPKAAAEAVAHARSGAAAKAAGASAGQHSEARSEPAPRPRLQRLSLGEVQLVTTDQPRWRPALVSRTAQSTTIRFVPLTPAGRTASIRVLNAARQQGLAARTRLALQRKGWRQVAIGDASRVRQKSLVLYSVESAPAARRLAAELGFAIARDPRPGPITVLLGRDALVRSDS